MKKTAALLSVLIAGCMVGQDYKRPEQPAVERYTREPLPEKTVKTDAPFGEEQKFLTDLDISHAWWTRFESPKLNALIERALKASPTLAAQKAALRQARELVLAQKGFFFPTLQAGFSPGAQKTSAFSSPTPANGDLIFRLYTTQLTAAWTLDVFGGNRRQVESLQALADFQRFQFEAAYVTLASSLVAAVVQEAAIRAQVDAVKEIIALVSKSLDILKKQLELGAVTGLDVAAQEAALAQAKQALPPLARQLEQTRNLIRALTGEYPNANPDEAFDLASLHLPTELPLTLPSRIVEQRPDVRAAEEQLHSACAQIGVAEAKLLPQFTLTGSYGGLTDNYNALFSAENVFWSLVASITQTLFDGGTLVHQKRAAEWAFVQAAELYRGTVVAAFQNVADSLYALHADADNLKAAVESEQAAKKTLDITQKRVDQGLVNYLSLLSAQQVYQQALILRVQAQALRLADTAALFQALGGGWWNRPEENNSK